MYKPSFSITPNMLTKAMLITEKISKIVSYGSLKKAPILRRNNKIKSVHSSLIIEANSLSLNQVRDIISGKLVIGPKKEIQEVKNAYKAYEMIEEFDGYSENDLLKAHGILTYLLEDEAGKYRTHGEGVFDDKKLIFMAPPATLVPELMHNLFTWLKEDDETPILLKTCVFHYEFLFIHPFRDGNGRLARLWQNVLLAKWNRIFEYIPIESQIQKYQGVYYNAIANCHNSGNSNEFIEFMLKVIDETLNEVIIQLNREVNNISEQVNKLLEVMEYDIPISSNEIMQRLNIKSKETLRGSYLNPAIENGLVKMTLPDKPNSKNQKYMKI